MKDETYEAALENLARLKDLTAKKLKLLDELERGIWQKRLWPDRTPEDEEPRVWILTPNFKLVGCARVTEAPHYRPLTDRGVMRAMPRSALANVVDRCIYAEVNKAARAELARRDLLESL
jgi:hypothetical protein